MSAIKLYSWNVNGIRAAAGKGFLDWLKKEAPGILCIQETKARPEQLSPALINVPSYHSYFSSAERKGYSGVALYSLIEPKRLLYGFGLPKFDSEGRIIAAEYGDFTLINIYYPNGKQNQERLQYKMEFYDAFLNWAEDLRKQKPNLIVCGDINTAHREIDLARPKENEKVSGFLPEERAWLDKFLHYGYIDTFRLFNQEKDHYTWWDQKSRARERNVGWRIDYFFVTDNLEDKVIAADIHPSVQGSDHCPISLVIDI